MNPSIEDRLRAHFADRSAREPLVPATPAPPRLPAPRRDRRRLALVAAAAIIVIGAVAGTVAVLAHDDSRQIDTIRPDQQTTTTQTPTTAAPTTATTTTTSPPSAADIRSVVVSGVGVLGGWDGAQWVNQDRTATLPVHGGERYLAVGVDEPITEAVGSAPGEDCDVGFGPLQDVDMEPDVFAGRLPEDFPDPIAVTGVPDPQPRPVVRLATDAPVYVEAARQVLLDAGIDAPQPHLQDVVQVDFDGDGTDEVLVVAEQVARLDLASAAMGDYSIVFVRKVVDGEVQTIVLWSSTVTPEAATGALYNGLYFIVVGRLHAIADLNGDGRMEIAVYGVYYEGSGSYVFEHDSLQPVLRLECGV